MLCHLVAFLRGVRTRRPALFSVQCGLWEGLRTIMNIFNQDSCFKIKVYVSTEIRTGKYPDPLHEVEDRCFICGGGSLFCIGFRMFFAVFCNFLLSGILEFFRVRVFNPVILATLLCIIYTAFLISVLACVVMSAEYFYVFLYSLHVHYVYRNQSQSFLPVL